MKILHIVPSLEIGGAERLAFDICNELYGREDIKVKLLILRDVNDFGNRPYIKHVKASIQLSLYRKNTFQLKELQQEIDQFRPDIIHTHLFMAEIVSRFCTYKKAQWFSHFHDNMPQLKNVNLNNLFSKKDLANAYEKHLLYKRYRANGGNHFIAISRNAQAYAKSVLPKAAHIEYLKNAINYQAFYRPLLKLRKKEPIRLINVGSFQKKKNQQFLIEVMKLLQEKIGGFELYFLGDGKEIANVKEKVRRYKLENAVFFKGNVKDVKNYLAESDIYVHAAYYEPFGLVLLEAMAAGLPVVCLNGGGNADIVEDGVNGFMLEEASAELYANRIEELIGGESLYEKIAERGQETAQSYGIESYCDKLMKIYKDSMLKA